MSQDETVSLAHLSDVHLPAISGFTPGHWNAKRVLGFINWQRKRRHIHSWAALDAIVADAKAQRPDHFLVSGDLVNIGLPAEYETARGWLGGLGPPGHVSVVPGNHDIYVPLKADPGVARWADYMRGDADGAQRGAGQGGSAGDGAVAAGHDGPAGFPYLRRIGPVALIGLNSAEPTPIGYAGGRLGRPQLQRLAGLLAETATADMIRLVMIHHPPLQGLAPRRRALSDAAAFEDVLRAHGASLVVHGHNHRNMHNRLGSIPVIGVASASAGRSHGGEPAGCYNMIRITRRGSQMTIAIETRGFTGGGNTIGSIGSPLVTP